MSSKYTSSKPVDSGICLNEEQLMLLASNQLSEQEAQPLKKHLESCEFCQDALEGARYMNEPAELPRVVGGINMKIREGAGSIPKGIHWPKMYTVGIAASILLLLGFLFTQPIFLGENGGLAEDSAMPPQEENLALEKRKPLEEEDSKNSEDDTAEEGELEAISPAPSPAPPSATRSSETVAKADESPEIVLKDETYSDGSLEADSAEGAMAIEEVKVNARETTLEKNKASANSNGVQDAAEEKESFPLPMVEMQAYKHPSFNAQQNRLMKKGREAFNAGRLKEAENYFQQLLSQVPQSRVANYLAGLNYLYLEQPEKAREKLMQVAKRQGEVSFELVNWPSVLSLLKNGETEKAKQLLQTYSQQEGLIRIR